MGTASSFSENRATKWIDISSIVVVNWGNSLMRSSHALLRLSFKVMLYTSGIRVHWLPVKLRQPLLLEIVQPV